MSVGACTPCTESARPVNLNRGARPRVGPPSRTCARSRFAQFHWPHVGRCDRCAQGRGPQGARDPSAARRRSRWPHRSTALRSRRCATTPCRIRPSTGRSLRTTMPVCSSARNCLWSATHAVIAARVAGIRRFWTRHVPLDAQVAPHRGARPEVERRTRGAWCAHEAGQCARPSSPEAQSATSTIACVGALEGRCSHLSTRAVFARERRGRCGRRRPRTTRSRARGKRACNPSTRR